ncbi:LuxR C-terminal-related transcriptional regulator [Actinoplanes utahensis]|uniref:LuxR family transcriptional regulator n=1 Tax=Actinoplanes utahensis TaxID=1869 RepID=A0A0A6UG72_ACTUT|nr:response regulator transcription factor [Actinoplanes utahensis]KHD74103.1 LuxR family transcriptional regulator [Actinoplanes utahensis]GIF35589.1 DNA-binding response regulator [Actinoplanes utahensis]
MRNGSRIVVVSGHAPLVRGLEQSLPEATRGRATVAGANDGSDVAAVVREAVPDLILVDLRPPAGLPAVTAARAAAPHTRILVLAGEDAPATVDVLRAGASGVLPRGEELIPPLLAALEGWAVVPVQLLAGLVDQNGRQVVHPATAQLDESDRRLLRLIANGSSTSEIAGLLHVSDRTVKRLTAALLRKLHVSSRTEAAAVAGIAGLV